MNDTAWSLAIVPDPIEPAAVDPFEGLSYADALELCKRVVADLEMGARRRNLAAQKPQLVLAR